jgi:alkylated DNA repair dioxygenase AlkB
MPQLSHLGAQNETLLHYHAVKTMPLIEEVLRDLQRLEPGLNHIIGTLYESETDTIGFHSDQATDIREGSNIYLLSLGATRNLTLKRKSDAVTFDIPLNAGDLFIMDLKTNDEYEHAILPSDIKTEPRISLVVRDIKTTRSRGEIKVK